MSHLQHASEAERAVSACSVHVTSSNVMQSSVVVCMLEGDRGSSDRSDGVLTGYELEEVSRQ
jgi:hypothetical protein